MRKLLLHTCCAPCSIAIIDELRRDFALTVFFFNPNIYPLEEYERRKAEVIKVCLEWGVPMVDGDYRPMDWEEAIKGWENEPEMGARCPVCFKYRLAVTARYARAHGFEIFATSLTMGRNKSAAIINPIGLALAREQGLTFHNVDWKKEGRQEAGRRLVAERGIYRQNYCGCKYSLINNRP